MSHHVTPLETDQLFYADSKDEKSGHQLTKGCLLSFQWIGFLGAPRSLGYYGAFLETVDVGISEENELWA